MSDSTRYPFQFIPSDQGSILINGILCKVSSASTGDSYTVLELTLPPKSGAPLHVHRLEDEVFHVIEGVCEIICGGETYLAQIGTIAVLPKNTPHAFRNPTDTPTRIIITAVPGGLDTYFEELSRISSDDPNAAQKSAEINTRYQIEF